MRLDQALVARSLCDSRTEAQELIENALVLVNGEIAKKRTKTIEETDLLELKGGRQFVSRGGSKLYGILQDIYGNDAFIRMHTEGKRALDVGSSTGGFTDCLLHFGAAHVDAVDVGKEQLHDKLRSDSRVSLFESTDIRSFTSKTSYDLIVADLSFISLELVLDKIVSFGAVGTEYFLLIKPQFEVGKGQTKKGIVKNVERIVEVIKKYEVESKLHSLKEVSILPCHIQGGDGNQEFFIYGKRA